MSKIPVKLLLATLLLAPMGAALRAAAAVEEDRPAVQPAVDRLAVALRALLRPTAPQAAPQPAQGAQ